MNSFVSIIIPTFNRANLIKDTINSVLAQSYKNFELIIGDDGSTDNTEEVINSIKDLRIVYLPLPHAGLPATPRNKGIEISKGEFIAILDSDDLWLPNKLEKCLSCFESMTSMGLVCSNEFIIKKTVPTLETLQERNGKDEFIDLKKLFMGNIISSSTAVVHRKCLDNVGNFNESKSFRAVEDYQLWLRIASKFPILYLGEPLGYCRFHEQAISRNTEESLINLYNTLIDFFQQFPDLIKPFHRAATKRIRSVNMSIIRLYIKRKSVLQSLKWVFEIIKPIK